jgi:hypothetical protein
MLPMRLSQWALPYKQERARGAAALRENARGQNSKRNAGGGPAASQQRHQRRARWQHSGTGVAMRK